jgi:hypothetical protein
MIGPEERKVDHVKEVEKTMLEEGRAEKPLSEEGQEDMERPSGVTNNDSDENRKSASVPENIH